MKPQTKLLCLSLAAVLAMLAWLPPAAHAVRCCSFDVHTIYYSDAQHSQVVGSCDVNEACAGSDFCSGQRSSFSTTSSTCCINCSE